MVNFLSDGPTHSNVLRRDKKRSVGPRTLYLAQVNIIRLPSGYSLNLRSLNNIATEIAKQELSHLGICTS